MQRSRLYRYSSDGLQLQEARWARTRLAFIGVFVGALLLLVGLEINQRFDDVLGIGIVRSTSLVNENRALREQLQFVASRIQKLQSNLAQLGDQGNEFRLRMNLTPIDSDVLQAGVGGTDDRIDLGTSAGATDLLNNLNRMVGSAERELKLQLDSYSDVERKFEDDKVRFAHLPAVKPMDGYYSKSFGMRLHPILGVYRPHQGIDIVNETGTPVRATADGIVHFAGRESGLGLAVMVNHGYGFRTIFGHLSQIQVREGQQVKRGDIIARSGNTGLSTAPHLHYEVRVNGVAQNPIDYFFDDVLRLAQAR